jgi:hypothetical protein
MITSKEHVQRAHIGYQSREKSPWLAISNIGMLNRSESEVIAFVNRQPNLFGLL